MTLTLRPFFPLFFTLFLFSSFSRGQGVEKSATFMSVPVEEGKKRLNESRKNLSKEAGQRVADRSTLRNHKRMGDGVKNDMAKAKTVVDKVPNILGVRKVLNGILTTIQVGGFLQRAYGRAGEELLNDMVESTDEIMLEGATQHYENILTICNKISKNLNNKGMYQGGETDPLTLSAKILDLLSPKKHIQTLTTFLDKIGFTTTQKDQWEKIQDLGTQLKQERYMFDIIMNDMAIKLIERQIMKLIQAKHKDQYIQGLQEQMKTAGDQLGVEQERVHSIAEKEGRLVTDAEMQTKRGIVALIENIQKDIESVQTVQPDQVDSTIKSLMIEVTKLQNKGNFLREHKKDPLITGIMNRLGVLEEKINKLVPPDEEELDLSAHPLNGKSKKALNDKDSTTSSLVSPPKTSALSRSQSEGKISRSQKQPLEKSKVKKAFAEA